MPTTRWFMLFYVCSAVKLSPKDKHSVMCDNHDNRGVFAFSKPAASASGTRSEAYYKNQLLPLKKGGAFISSADQKRFKEELSGMLDRYEIIEAFKWSKVGKPSEDFIWDWLIKNLNPPPVANGDWTLEQKKQLVELASKKVTVLQQQPQITTQQLHPAALAKMRLLSPDFLSAKQADDDKPAIAAKEFLFSFRSPPSTPVMYKTSHHVDAVEPKAALALLVKSGGRINRAWHDIQAVNGTSGQLEIVTFNVLSNDLLKTPPKQKASTLEWDPHCDWNHRRVKLLAELLRLDEAAFKIDLKKEELDVRQLNLPYALTMQEVDAAAFVNVFGPILKALGYKGAYVSKKAGTSAREGNAVFIRATDDVVFHPFHLTGFVDGESVGTPYGLDELPEYTWPQSALIAVHGNRAIATLHGGHAPGALGAHLRELQIRETYGLADKIMNGFSKPKRYIFVTGDTNDVPNSRAWREATETLPLDSAYPTSAATLDTVGWSSSKTWELFPHAELDALAAKNNNKQAELTKAIDDSKKLLVQIDAIFHTRNVKTIKVLKPPSGLAAVSPLIPSWYYPSDHIRLGAKVILA